MKCIAYKKDYKYQLKENYLTDIPIKPGINIITDYIDLTVNGNLIVKKGYAWDGPSGPTIDTLNFMRGSLVHDALYQLMREEKIDNKKFRNPADKLLQQMCRDDGMTAIRAWLVYIGVRYGGGPAADPANKKPIVMAPKTCR